MDADEWEAKLERLGVIKPTYNMIRQFDGTYKIVLGHPLNNEPAVKTELTWEEASAFMKLLK
jgi:hypothetical protein